ncbi:MAG: UDP-3-O-[3-hydroxymyristoyl] N-acetylglucosamine deacetylase [Rhodospirillaceae bacterium]|jgi:UDP-3-O-[3-hydroxymyristoyl] N-acetylglucosamine deacetylase|nr:UDP-3-O-[3-hydroxymyristoyl] N-acetylglucosamine deacetylase [Rhodospirillaceae bacterium]
MTETDSDSAAGVARPVQQTTLKNSIHCSGTALHHGGHVTMAMHPAPADTGIVFRRSDLAGKGVAIPADWRHVADMPMCTSLMAEGVQVATIEHVMAALAGCGVDNLLIEINGPELPIMDGSAWPFVFLIECAGIAELDAPRRYLRILHPVSLTTGARSVSLSPGEGFIISFEVDYDSGAIARQHCEVDLGGGAFKNELSRARTFGFLHEVDALRAAGLARGASLDNAIVVTGDGVLNEGGLRFPDEFVRHKMLDVLGDLYLAGAPIVGRFEGRCSGHKLNHRLLRALFQRREAWCWSDSTALALPVEEPRRAAGFGR